MSKLSTLAQHANNGASNPYALIRALADALEEVNPRTITLNTEVKIVLGQISFLMGESMGPSMETQTAYQDQLNKEPIVPLGYASQDPKTGETKIRTR